MIKSLGKFESCGKQFLQNRPHLAENTSENPVLDFSMLNIAHQPIQPFHKIFNTTEALKINLGDQLDERYPIQHGTIDNPAISLEQEIYVQGSIVVWSRAGHVVKTLDYSFQDQPIQNVLFAWFPVSAETDPTNKNTGDIGLSDLGGDKYYWDIFSKEEDEENDGEPSAKKHTRLLETEEQDQSSQLQRRALCIVFQSFIKIYYEDGFNVTAHVPFEIGQVLPLDKGIIVNRKYIPEDRRSKQNITKLASTSTKSDSPDFYTVTHPSKGPCPVKILPNIISKLPEPLTTSQQLLFATLRPTETGRLPVFVTFSKKEHRHYIWAYKRNSEPTIPAKSNDTIYPQLPAKRKATTTYDSRGRSLTGTPNRNKKQKMTPTRPSQFYETDEELLYDNESERQLHLELLDTSEISLQLLWKETVNLKISTKLKLLRNVRSDAFLVHDLNGEELICIMNYSLGQLQLINLNKATSNMKECVEYTVAAKSAIPIYASRDNYIDLLYIDSLGNLQLFIDCSMPKRNIESLYGPVVKLMDPVYDKCTLLHQDNTMRRYQLQLRPDTSLVRDCFAAIGCAASFYFSHIWSAYLDRSPTPATEWECFFITLLSFLKLKKKSARHYYVKDTRVLASKENKRQQVILANTKFVENEMGFKSQEQCDFLLDEAYREGVSTRWVEEILNSWTDITLDLTTFSDIIKSLHVVYEDYRVKTTMAAHTQRLGYLLMQSAIILGQQDWIEYYESCGVDPNFAGNLQSAEEDKSSSLVRPPNIQVCLRQMTPATSSNAMLLSYFGVSTLDPALGICQNSYATTIKNLWALYGAMNHGSGDKSLLLERMVANRITRRDITVLTESMTKPILAILDQLKMNPQVNWTKEAYKIIGRDDIYKQLHMQVTLCDPNTDTFKLPFQKASDVPKSMSELIKESLTTFKNNCVFETDVLNMETERLRFGFGGVIEKIRIMLDSTKVSEYFVQEQPEKPDDELAIEHQNLVGLLLHRTLALSVGRAIYAFGTYIPDITKVLPIEPFNTSAKILPLRTIVNVDENVLTNDIMNWPNFHNGVAAGLRISPSNSVDHSYIDFSCPSDLEPQHGGLLLAMGLNGVLKKLPLLDYYRFMTQTGELALIGFILAASVAYRGTKESKITKVLSVYIPALLLPDSASFNHSNLIQATALLGMGLNYMNSCDRQMGASMLREIGKNGHSDPSFLDPNYEGCALAAGFSLGFITLGMGDRALEVIDIELTSKLYKLMVGQSDLSVAENLRQPAEEKGSINLDVTSPGATIALGLMYLKTENAKVAEMIEIPERRPYLNSVRPDFMLLRVLVKNLIMWSTIQPTEAWIDGQLPAFITSNDGMDQAPASSIEEDYQNMLIDDEVLKQASYYIICGACLSMGLRFAGSRNKEAFRVLLDRLDFFMKLQLVQETNPQQHITKCIVRTCVDVVCTAAAMVMAGTGNRELVDRLEQLNGRITADMSYGDHMAVSMSLGLLFMGLGGYTLSTTNESIAGLLCAFYPFYPITTEDNRYHLQAFRHLWVMGIDSRWLIPFDVADEKPCRVPMNLELYDDDGSQGPSSHRKIRQVRIEAPTVVPDYKLIKSIELDGERYWPISANMTENGKYQNSIIKSGVIYVQRRENKKSYEDDPTGLYTHYDKFTSM